jgi:CBS domain containing-hemolysin-like protein
LLENLYERGYSRIPVYDFNRKEIKGILMSKDLILMNPDKDNPTVEQISSILRDAKEIDVETNAMEALTFFLENQGHMVVVYEKKEV